jgi:hypothetical protein
VAKTRMFVSTNKWLPPGVTIDVFPAEGGIRRPGGHMEFCQQQRTGRPALKGAQRTLLNHHHHPVRTRRDRFRQFDFERLILRHFTDCLDCNHVSGKYSSKSILATEMDEKSGGIIKGGHYGLGRSMGFDTGGI